MSEIEYTMLSPEERLMTVRDTLRGRETDHLRLSVMTNATEPSRATRLPHLEEEIKRLQALVKKLEAGK